MNPYGLDSNLSSKMFQGLLEMVGSNLDSRENCSNNRNRILSEEKEETKAMDSNPCKKDSIPFEVQVKKEKSRIRILSTMIRIQESREVKNT